MNMKNNNMKPIKKPVAKKQTDLTAFQLKLSKEFKRLRQEIEDTQQDMSEMIETISFKQRKDVPVIFKNEKGNEIFKTFNLNVIPRLGEKFNLRPTPGSCCLNAYLIDEFDLSEQQLINHVMNDTYFSFIVSDVATNLSVIDSHPDDEWDDMNGVNFNEVEEDYNMTYVITLQPNNSLKKEVLIEKIR